MFDFDVRSGQEPASAPMLADLSRMGLLPEELSEPVTTIPRRAPVVVSPASGLMEALKTMGERHATAALVASHGVLLGMLSERDLVRRLLDPRPPGPHLPVSEVMTPELDSLLESDTISYAVRKLWALGGRPMPIVRPNGTLFGLLETQDVLAWLCERATNPGPRHRSHGSSRRASPG